MTLWDSKRSLDPLPQSRLNVTLREGREERAESSRGLTSVTRDPGASQKQMGPRWEGKQGGEALSWDPISTLQPQGCGGLTGEETKAVQGWDLPRFLL